MPSKDREAVTARASAEAPKSAPTRRQPRRDGEGAKRRWRDRSHQTAAQPGIVAPPTWIVIHEIDSLVEAITLDRPSLISSAAPKGGAATWATTEHSARQRKQSARSARRVDQRSTATPKPTPSRHRRRSPAIMNAAEPRGSATSRAPHRHASTRSDANDKSRSRLKDQVDEVSDLTSLNQRLKGANVPCANVIDSNQKTPLV